MSTSRHPVALRLERIVGGDARLLALIMGLPLLDGVFAALVLSRAIADPIGAIQVGLLIFGGSATVAVILADMDGTPRDQAKIVLLVGVPIIVIAAIQAALAPAIESVLDIVIFERFAALVIAAIAAKTASATVGEYLPSPGVIIGLGLVASIDPSGAELAILADSTLVAYATASAVIGVSFALMVALLGPYLRLYVDIDRFRFGSAVALGLLPLAILDLAFGNAPLAVLIVTAVFSIDPGREELGESVRKHLPGGGSGSGNSTERSANRDTANTDASTEGSAETGSSTDPYRREHSDDSSERAPWL